MPPSGLSYELCHRWGPITPRRHASSQRARHTPSVKIKCMSRLGQGDLGLRSHRVGTVWVRRISADLALHPRLALAAGCQLHEVAARPAVAGHLPASEALVGFRIASLGGQLRWRSERGPVIGDLSFPRGLEHVRSASDPSEHEFTMCCDVAPHVLERVEAERGGAPPVFWMDLAGSWAINGSIEPIYQTPWRFVVPADIWFSFLATSGFRDFDVLELRRTLQEGGDLQSAIDHLNAARALASSEPGGAVGLCRLVVEALDAVLKRKDGHGSLAEHLMACTDKRRGEQYGRIISSIKQLAGLKHHHFGEDNTFTRAEALALVRVSEALVLMVGELSPRLVTESDADGGIP